MGALLDHFRESGVALAALPGDRLLASGALTDAHRATIREHKAAILAELAANDPTTSPQSRQDHQSRHSRHVSTVGVIGATGGPGAAQSDAELRRLVAIVSVVWPADEKADALAAALADPEAALACFHSLVAERAGVGEPREERVPSDGMRPCTACANLSPGGRCLAVHRGESLGDGIATGRECMPLMIDRPQRCLAYAPGAADPDRRTGRQRWSVLLERVTT